MRRSALASLVVLAAGCASNDLPPREAGESAGMGQLRVGDRHDLRFVLEEVRAGAPREVTLRVFVEVVKREGARAWVRLGVRDAQGAPVAHPTAAGDLVVPFVCPSLPEANEGHGDVERERLTLASGRVLDCDVLTRVDEDAGGAVTRDWIAPLALPLLGNRARLTSVRYGPDGEYVRLLLEVTDLAVGARDGDGGALPPDALVLFQPGTYEVTRDGDGLLAHRFENELASDYQYAREPLVPFENGTLVIDGTRYAEPGPFDPERAVAFSSIGQLLLNRALAVARGEPETDPVVAWRQRPIVQRDHAE